MSADTPPKARKRRRSYLWYWQGDHAPWFGVVKARSSESAREAAFEQLLRVLDSQSVDPPTAASEMHVQAVGRKDFTYAKGYL